MLTLFFQFSIFFLVSAITFSYKFILNLEMHYLSIHSIIAILVNVSSKIIICRQILFCFICSPCTHLLILDRNLILVSNILLLLSEIIFCLKGSNCTSLLITDRDLLTVRHLCTNINLISYSHLIKIRHCFIHVLIFILGGIFTLTLHVLVSF